MDNPVDNVVDLGLVNYVQHPSNPKYVVFRFADIERANSYEEALTSSKIWFEKSSDFKREKEYFLFGIHKNDFKKAEKINYLVEAKHKKPFIPFKILRYTIMIISAGILTIAILGYCNSRKILNSIDNPSALVNIQK